MLVILGNHHKITLALSAPWLLVEAVLLLSRKLALYEDVVQVRLVSMTIASGRDFRESLENAILPSGCQQLALGRDVTKRWTI